MRTTVLLVALTASAIGAAFWGPRALASPALRTVDGAAGAGAPELQRYHHPYPDAEWYRLFSDGLEDRVRRAEIIVVAEPGIGGGNEGLQSIFFYLHLQAVLKGAPELFERHRLAISPEELGPDRRRESPAGIGYIEFYNDQVFDMDWLLEGPMIFLLRVDRDFRPTLEILDGPTRSVIGPANREFYERVWRATREGVAPRGRTR